MNTLTRDIKRIYKKNRDYILTELIEEIHGKPFTKVQLMTILDEILNKQKPKKISGYSLFLTENSHKDNVSELWDSMTEKEQEEWNIKASNHIVLKKPKKEICKFIQTNGKECQSSIVIDGRCKRHHNKTHCSEDGCYKIADDTGYCKKHLPSNDLSDTEIKEKEIKKCEGLTKTGKQCSKNAIDNGFCKHHEPKEESEEEKEEEKEIKKCERLTKTGKQCSRNALDNGFCKLHEPKEESEEEVELSVDESAEEAEEDELDDVPELKVKSKKEEEPQEENRKVIKKGKKTYFVDDDLIVYDKNNEVIGFYDDETDEIIFD